MINNEQDLLDYWICDNFQEFKRTIYKSTACGAWAKALPNGVLFGSIVEGSDAEYTADPLLYPFSYQDLRNTLAWLDTEVEIAWKEANE